MKTYQVRTLALVSLLSVVSTLNAQIIDVSDDAELAAAISQVSGGETIRLAPGNYGRVKIQGGGNVTVGSSSYSAPSQPTAQVTITSSNAATLSQLDSIDINGSGNWRVSQVAVRPASGATTAVKIIGSDNFVFSSSTVTYGNSTGWSATDWLANAGEAVSIQSTENAQIENNRLTTVDHGISIYYESPNAVVRGNVIDGIRGDGLRGLSDYGLFERNIAKNFYDVDENHDDCFQSWSYENGLIGEGAVVGNILRENCCIAYEDPDQPLRATPQGIGLFDGDFQDWTIENNIIAIDHWHGISVYGAIDTTITNNTVIDLNSDDPGPSWIRVLEGKDGSAATGNTIANNIMTHAGWPMAGNSYSNNEVISMDDYDDWFVDWENGNFSLKSTAPNLSVGANGKIVAVPEPSAAMLAILGFWWLLGARARRGKQ